MLIRVPPHAATEAQSFSIQAPELFFHSYSPPRNDGTFKQARSKLEEELRFVSKNVRL
jgi:syntaxin-binding protein 1